MSASRPSADTGCVPASQYSAMRSLTPAATAQCMAVLRGQRARATETRKAPQPVAVDRNGLRRFSTDATGYGVHDSDGTEDRDMTAQLRNKHNETRNPVRPSPTTPG